MLIIHRCTKCHHPNYWHRPSDPSNCGEGCHRGRCDWGPPETAPRWRTADNSPITEVAEPGTLKTCDCASCKALYAELTGRVAA